MKRVRLLTDRLVIRALPPSAAGRVARFHSESWHFHRQWEPHRREEYFQAPTQRRILRGEAASDAILHLWLLLRDPGRPEGTRQSGTRGVGASTRGRGRRTGWRRLPIVGSVTLSSITGGFFRNCFLGYKIDARYARRGFMREALLATLDYAFDEMELHRVEANVMPRNRPSLELVRGLGFREEGLAREYLEIQGRWEDHIHMVTLNYEWRENRGGA